MLSLWGVVVVCAWRLVAVSLLLLLPLLWITAQGITSSKTIARMMHGINRERLDFETPYLLLLLLLLLLPEAGTSVVAVTGGGMWNPETNAAAPPSGSVRLMNTTPP